MRGAGSTRRRGAGVAHPLFGLESRGYRESSSMAGIPTANRPASRLTAGVSVNGVRVVDAIALTAKCRGLTLFKSGVLAPQRVRRVAAVAIRIGLRNCRRHHAKGADLCEENSEADKEGSHFAAPLCDGNGTTTMLPCDNGSRPRDRVVRSRRCTCKFRERAAPVNSRSRLIVRHQVQQEKSARRSKRADWRRRGFR